MLNNKISLVMITFFLLIGVASALTVQKTEFVIKTEPYQNLSVVIVDVATKAEVGLFEGRARKFGEYRFTYYGTVSKVNLLASIVNNDTQEVLKTQTFGPYTLGTPTISADFYLNQETPETPEATEELNSSAQSSNATENSPVTGLVVGEGGEFSKVYYYVGAAVLGVLVLVFVFKRRLAASIKSAPVEPSPSKVIKSRPIKTEKTEVSVKNTPQKSNESNISETEKRISDLQKQLEQIRSEEKLAKLQKQINLEKQSLKKMQDEDNQPQQQNQQFQNQNNNQNQQ